MISAIILAEMQIAIYLAEQAHLRRRHELTSASKCEYCGSIVRGDRCDSCGAPRRLKGLDRRVVK